MKFQHVVLTVFICMIWGFNFVASKVAVSYFPSFFMLAMRLTIVSLVLLPFIKKPEVPIKDLVLISFIFTVVHFGTMFLALENGIDVAVAVVVDQMRVPFAVALGYFVCKEQVNRRTVFGVTAAIFGTFVIVGTPNVISNYWAFLTLLLSAAAWAIYNIRIKRLGDIDLFSFIGWVSIIGVPMLYTISYLYEGNNFHLLVDPPMEAVLALLYIAIGATIVAHGSWYYLLKRYDVAKVVPYSLLVPIFGMFAGIVFMSEDITLNIIIGGILTIIGVGIVYIKSPKAGRAGDEI